MPTLGLSTSVLGVLRDLGEGSTPSCAGDLHEIAQIGMANKNAQLTSQCQAAGKCFLSSHNAEEIHDAHP